MIWLTTIAILVLITLIALVFVNDEKGWEDVYEAADKHSERVLKLFHYLREQGIQCRLHSDAAIGVGARTCIWVKKKDRKRARELVMEWFNRKGQNL